MSSISLCSRCENPITYRYVDGRPIPFHFDGLCINGGDTGVNDFTGFKRSDEACCFSTSCPSCGGEVFFIRHNGGSVWVDPPLGYPWNKHECFESPKTSLADLCDIEIPNKNGSLLIGVVKLTHVEPTKEATKIILETGKSGSIKLYVKNNAGFLLGRLCIYDKNAKTIFPFEEVQYLFIAHERRNYFDLVECPECGVKVSPKNLEKHLSVLVQTQSDTSS